MPDYCPIGYFLVSNLARLFIFVRSTNPPVYFYAVHQIRKRVPKFTSQFFECFNQSDRFSILFFVVKRFVKIRSGPEYEKIFSLVPSKKGCRQRNLRQTKCFYFSILNDKSLPNFHVQNGFLGMLTVEFITQKAEK